MYRFPLCILVIEIWVDSGQGWLGLGQIQGTREPRAIMGLVRARSAAPLGASASSHGLLKHGNSKGVAIPSTLSCTVMGS